MMNSSLAQLLMITGALNLLLFLSAIPFIKNDDKSPAIFCWFFSIFIYAGASIFLGGSYLINHETFKLPHLSIAFAFFLLVQGYSGGAVFFRYLQRSVSWKKLGKVFAYISLFNICAIYYFLQLPRELRLLAPALWTIAISGWLFLELRNLVINNNEYLVYLLKIMTCITFFPSFIWLTVFANFYLQVIPSLQWDQIIELDQTIRVIRNITTPFIFAAIFVYWIKYHSYFARKLASQQQSVELLMQEKDHLILQLSNINSIVTSGALAAGLAHELNQYLARIQLNAEEAIQRLNKNESGVADALKRILQANLEASTLISSLKSTIVGKAKEESWTLISDVIIGVKDIYNGWLKKSNIQIYLNLDNQIARISWGALLSQVISNLVSNAIEALDIIDKANKIITIRSYHNDKSFLINVSNNGPAISREFKENIFNIFNTSKKEGTGIGLWLSKFIIQRRGGNLYFENIPDGGVSFVIEIPVEALE